MEENEEMALYYNWKTGEVTEKIIKGNKNGKKKVSKKES